MKWATSSTKQPPKKSRRLISYAVLTKDRFSQKKFWVTFDGSGENEVAYSGGRPLLFPPEGLEVGTRIDLLSPEE